MTESRKQRKPASGWLLGVGTASVELPGWAADWLERQTNLAARRVQVRGVDRDVDEVLAAIRWAAMAWRGAASGDASESGSPLPVEAEVAPRSSSGALLGVAQAAGLVGISDRAVRLACAEKRLPARRINGRWLIERRDVQTYRDNRRITA